MVMGIDRRRALAAIGGAALSPALTVAPSVAQPVRRRVTFSPAATGQAPEDFTVTQSGDGPPAAWAVTRDPTAPPPGMVLEQTSTAPAQNRFPVALLNGTTERNAMIAVRFRIVSGQVAQAAGLLVRWQDPGTCYAAGVDARLGEVGLWAVKDGVATRVGGVRAAVARDRWQSLIMRVESDSFVVSLNDTPLFGTDNRAITQGGRIGFWTKADTVARFAYLQIDALP